MTLGRGMRARRGVACAAAGVAMTMALLAAPGASASPRPVRHDTATQAIGRSWRSVYIAPSGTPMTLLAVAALNLHDAWAVGYTQSNNAVALHWTNGRWRRVPVPDAHLYFPVYVAASSRRDVWVFGYRNTPAGQVWQAVRWDGRAWHQVPAPPEPGVPNEVGFLVLGRSDVWFPSQDTCTSRATGTVCKTPVCHWNGHAWVVYHLGAHVTSLAATGRSNIWAAGFRRGAGGRPDRNAHAAAYRWTGTAWRSVRMPAQAITGFHNGGPVVDTAGPRDTWIGSASESNGEALLLHWNGQRWREYGLPIIGGTAVIDPPVGVWTSPWTYRVAPTWRIVGDPSSMNDVTYLAWVPHSGTLLATGGSGSGAHVRARIFSYGKFG